MSKLWLHPQGRDEPIEVELLHGDDRSRESYRFHAEGGQAEVEVEALGEGFGWLRLHGRVAPYHAVRNKNVIEVWIGGRTYTVSVADRTAQRATGGAAVSISHAITAAMPGTILQIEVAPGDQFAAHQPLIVMESMKMEMTLSAPHDGRVKDVRCQVGELVEMGTVLATLDPADESARDS